ncbi:hypothetical protein [Nocardioides sp.]|uniref:hypothetical protein n=1 Tax=Nocardioides sp. TaxID=35761 RepID=UPI00356A885D
MIAVAVWLAGAAIALAMTVLGVIIGSFIYVIEGRDPYQLDQIKSVLTVGALAPIWPLVLAWMVAVTLRDLLRHTSPASVGGES